MSRFRSARGLGCFGFATGVREPCGFGAAFGLRGGLRAGMRGKFRGLPAIRNGGFGGWAHSVDCDCGAELRSCRVAAAFFT